jgi:hypothetical protein
MTDRPMTRDEMAQFEEVVQHNEPRNDVAAPSPTQRNSGFNTPSSLYSSRLG